jgi:hypothetical protein
MVPNRQLANMRILGNRILLREPTVGPNNLFGRTTNTTHFRLRQLVLRTHFALPFCFGLPTLEEVYLFPITCQVVFTTIDLTEFDLLLHFAYHYIYP